MVCYDGSSSSQKKKPVAITTSKVPYCCPIYHVRKIFLSLCRSITGAMSIAAHSLSGRFLVRRQSNIRRERKRLSLWVCGSWVNNLQTLFFFFFFPPHTLTHTVCVSNICLIHLSLPVLFFCFFILPWCNPYFNNRSKSHATGSRCYVAHVL